MSDLHGINIEELAKVIKHELGNWMLSEIGEAGLADAVWDHAPDGHYQDLTAEQQAEVVTAVSEVIYG